MRHVALVGQTTLYRLLDGVSTSYTGQDREYTFASCDYAFTTFLAAHDFTTGKEPG